MVATSRAMIRIIGALCALVWPLIAVAAPAAVGEITMLLGNVKLVGIDGVAREAGLKSAIHIGDSIETTATGHVHLRFVDGGVVSVRPASRLYVEDYSHSDAPAGQSAGQPPHQSGSIKFRLDEGVVRSITGRWGETARERFRLNTPIAAIGIRGTDFVVQSTLDSVRVAVHSGAVIVAPFGENCSKDALGSCQGAGAQQLSADMGHVMLEFYRQQPAAPRMLARNGMLADMYTPPRIPENVATAQKSVTTSSVAMADTMSESVVQTALFNSQPPPLTLSICTTDPTTPGCSAILPALATCTNAPATLGCSVVLPTFNACVQAPSTAGCAVVLPPLSACTNNPAAAGCNAVLPSLSVCTSTPTTPGCSVILPTLSSCTADPAAAGCSVVLPSLSVCSGVPTTPGCSVVLPSLTACINNPIGMGCGVVLPSLLTCTSTPTLPGCSVVLPSLSVCTTDPAKLGCSVVLPSQFLCLVAPSTPGCSAALPSLSTCLNTPTLLGCNIVLPTLNACISEPATPGCAVVLPTLFTCTNTPDTPGCSAILPTLNACISAPTKPGCAAVLPTIGVCTANPAAEGCRAVLPSLPTCTSAPSTPGCSAVLPSLAVCMSNPTADGCSAVLPSLPACTSAPAMPGCSVVLPPSTSLVWGRWDQAARRSGDSLTVSRIEAASGGRERVAENDYYVLYRAPQTGAFPDAATGSVSFGLASSQAHLLTTGATLPAQVQGGSLTLNFSSRLFNTALLLNSAPTGVVQMQAGGAILPDGTFSSLGFYTRVKGAFTYDLREAAYLFEHSTSQGMFTGITNWLR